MRYHSSPQFPMSSLSPHFGGLIFALWLLLPRFSRAQSAPDYSYWTTLAGEAGSLFDLLTALFTALALLFFFWGLALFVLKAGNEEERGKGRTRMVWGLVALFVIITVWGLVNLLFQIFGTDEQQTYGPPSVNYPMN